MGRFQQDMPAKANGCGYTDGGGLTIGRSDRLYFANFYVLFGYSLRYCSRSSVVSLGSDYQQHPGSGLGGNG